MKIIYLLVICSFILTQPVVAALAPSWEQKIIVVDHLDQDGRVIALDGTVFEIRSAEMRKQALAYQKQSVHILYVNMGGKYVASELKLATEPPFVIPLLEVKKKNTPE